MGLSSNDTPTKLSFIILTVIRMIVFAFLLAHEDLGSMLVCQYCSIFQYLQHYYPYEVCLLPAIESYAKKKQILAQCKVSANVFLLSARLKRNLTASWERTRNTILTFLRECF